MSGVLETWTTQTTINYFLCQKISVGDEVLWWEKDGTTFNMRCTIKRMSNRNIHLHVNETQLSGKAKWHNIRPCRPRVSCDFFEFTTHSFCISGIKNDPKTQTKNSSVTSEAQTLSWKKMYQI